MNCKKIGRRSTLSKRQCRKFTRRIAETWDWWSIMPINRWGTAFGLTSDTFCPTSIAYYYSTPSTCTCPANRYNHKLLYGSGNWRTIVTNRHRWRWNNHTANHFDIVIGTTIQEMMGNSSSLTNKQLCSMHVTNNSESGIFGLRKGVMLRSLSISSYHTGLLFHF